MAIKVSAINNMTSAKDSAILAFASDFLFGEGVVDLDGNDLKVTEQSPNAMAVDVNKGYVYVQNDGWAQGSNQPKFYRVEIDIKTGKTLTPNASANNWIVAICIKVDVGSLTPGASGELAGTIEAVYGTPAASPVAPAIPNHHYPIAYVTYNSSHAVITNARITDLRAQLRLRNNSYDEPLLDNNKAFKGEDSGGTARNISKVDSNNILQLGDESLSGLNPNKWDGWITANETWTYASADSPIFTFTISGDKTGKYSVGMKLRISQSTGGVKYGIIHAIAYSAPNTTVTVYMGTDYTLNNETISSPCYSPVRCPYGFPMNPDKWSVESTKGFSNLGGAATQNVYYNLGTWTIVVPIGVWKFDYEAVCAGSRASGDVTIQSTIATVNNGNTGEILGQTGQGAPFTRYQAPFAQSRILVQAAKQTYYHNLRTLATGITDLDISANAPRLSRMKVTSAYL